MPSIAPNEKDNQVVQLDDSGDFKSIKIGSDISSSDVVRQEGDGGDVEIETDDIFIEDDIDKSDCDIMCTVSQPEKVVSAMESFISYGVKTLTSRASFPGPEFFVRRRFSDFEWLFEALSGAYPASIIPPLPDKHAIKGVMDRFETDFVKTRMAGLEQFLARVSADSLISQAPSYKSFLTLKQYDFNAIKNDGNRLLAKIGKNFKSAVQGQPTQVPRRWDDEQVFTERMADRLTKIERINERLHGEMSNYKDEITALALELRTWEKSERSANDELIDSLDTLAHAGEKTAVCVTDMLKVTKKQFSPVLKEMNRYNQSVMQMLRRRNNMAYEAEKLAEKLSLKRCELENLRLNVSSLSILMFAQDPERARAEKSAHLDYEIKRMEEQERKLAEDVKQVETNMESSMEAYHGMRGRQITSAFKLFAQTQAHFFDTAASAWYEATPEHYRHMSKFQ